MSWFVALLSGTALHFVASAGRLAVGYALGAFTGAMLGVAAWTAGERRLLACDLMVGLPTMMWVPILMFAFGPGHEAVVAAVGLGTLFVVAQSTTVALASVDAEVAEAARLDGAGEAQAALLVVAPAAWPVVAAGLKLGFGYGWRALIGAEIAAAFCERGLGRMVWEARLWGDWGAMLAGLGAIAAFGAVFDCAVGGSRS